ncbi:metallopeptidase TldD-related protein [Patulibacter sp. SYSU D01012]|uniref:metallopeptidase TldD-related protein n=1 Tax=Patulibacter sp. SYSU D01012 TaxID=2817381 RepID=UPI001B30F472|nr:metallopeptidase TldD-related protein [Patulibacter sp. SYSU D01012]
MSTPTPAELADRALAALDGDGWASAVRDVSATVALPRGGQLRSAAAETVAVTLTAWRDGHVGTATTTATDADGLAAAAARAVRTAERTARDADGPGDATPPPEADGAPALDAADAATADADPGVGIDALLRARDAADARTPVAGRWHAGLVERALAASTGLRRQERTTDAHLWLRAGAGGVRSAVVAESARSAAALDAAALVRRALARIPGGDWHDPTPGEQTIVLTPQAVATVLDAAAALVLDGLAAADGRTRAAGRIGTRVAADAVTLVDDPTHAGTLPHAFDASGAAKRPLELIEGGTLRSLVHDGRSQATTGHATAPGGGAEGPRPTNLVLAPGDAASVEALIAGVDVGLLVPSIEALRPINAELGLAYGLAPDGASRIEDGRVVGAAGSVPLLVSPLDVLDGVDALTAAQTLVGAPTLGGRRVGHGVLAPGLRTRSGITVTD